MPAKTRICDNPHLSTGTETPRTGNLDLEDDRGLFDLGGLLMDLQELLGHNVDVVTEAGLRSRVAQRVLDDAVEL